MNINIQRVRQDMDKDIIILERSKNERFVYITDNKYMIGFNYTKNKKNITLYYFTRAIWTTTHHFVYCDPNSEAVISKLKEHFNLTLTDRDEYIIGILTRRYQEFGMLGIVTILTGESLKHSDCLNILVYNDHIDLEKCNRLDKNDDKYYNKENFQ